MNRDTVHSGASSSSSAWSRVLARWPIALGLAVVAVLLATGVVGEFSRGLVVAALIYLVWGVFRGAYRRTGRWLTVELAGVVVFGAATVGALLVDDTAARVLLGLGWLAHTGWDIIHHRLNAVVPRWWAEQCAVVDLIVGGLLLLALI
ncbi:hypothetical protein [Plantactinospora sp. GCM10030261]|uniref:hypothetical protein n=1 Tax=Plantactinospora sp. GCM10030261 TaxID=3273420 RepID=UPI00361C0CBC